MNDVTVILKSLHEAYVTATGLKLEFTFSRLHAWELWHGRGWGQAELLLVIGFLKEAARDGRRWSGSLNFRSLIEKPELFEEHLAEARSRARTPKIDRGKAEVLKATGRMEDQKAKPRSAAEIIAGEKAFEQFRALKQSL